MNYRIEGIADNARQAAAFYNGFASLLEGDHDDNQSYILLARVFDLIFRYEATIEDVPEVLLAYLAGAYDKEHLPDFDAREAARRGLLLKMLVRRIGQAKLTSDQIDKLLPEEAVPA